MFTNELRQFTANSQVLFTVNIEPLRRVLVLCSGTLKRTLGGEIWGWGPHLAHNCQHDGLYMLSYLAAQSASAQEQGHQEVSESHFELETSLTFKSGCAQ